MKKAMLFVSLLLCICLLIGCSQAKAPNSQAALEESPEKTEELAEKLMEVNAILNPRVIDDFTVENEMLIDLLDLVAYSGAVTNDQEDCALVFVALCKEGKAETVKEKLERYRQTMTGNLYIEFADKVEQAKNARVVTQGNYAVFVMAGIDGASYDEIDQAIENAFKAG